jgi:hypothetical protein
VRLGNVLQRLDLRERHKAGLYIWRVRARELRGPQVKLAYLNPPTQHLSIDRGGRVHGDSERVATGG